MVSLKGSNELFHTKKKKKDKEEKPRRKQNVPFCEGKQTFR